MVSHVHKKKMNSMEDVITMMHDVIIIQSKCFSVETIIFLRFSFIWVPNDECPPSFLSKIIG